MLFRSYPKFYGFFRTDKRNGRIQIFYYMSRYVRIYVILMIMRRKNCIHVFDRKGIDYENRIAQIRLKPSAAAHIVNGAILWEYQVWQYMVKTADVGLRAKNNLAKEIATPMSPAASKGEEAYLKGGCNGCHVIGQVSSGPDLTGVLLRHENAEKWVFDFIKDPAKFYNDEYVKSMIDFFNLRMPNQHMSDQEIKDIIEYLKWIDENAGM